jgi:hypothetical protein
MTAVLQRDEAPASIASVAAVRDADYTDVFSIATDGIPPASPEQWARAGVEHAAGLGGQFVWRVILRLRLRGGNTADRIAGWRIAERGDDWISLDASSSLLKANIVVGVGDGQVTIATCIRYDRPLAGPFWRPLSVVHRAAMPGLLRTAARHIASTVGAS